MTGLEGPIVAGLAGLAGKTLEGTVKKEAGTSIGQLLSRDIGKDWQQLVYRASQKYIEKYRARHCSLKVLGMRQPVPLEDVYTAVRLLDYCGLGEFESLQGLEQAYRERGQRQFSRSDAKHKRQGIEVANQELFLMVLGGPGAGKSTFLRRMGLEALLGDSGDYEAKCIPVFLELKRFTEPKIDITQLIEREFEICGFPKFKEMTASALKNGNLLILLDGLDEVPTANRDRIIDQIQDFVDRYDSNRFIASCRIAAYRSNFRRFVDVAMADFDDEQIKSFIDNWFGSQADQDSGTAAKCWEVLQQPENQGAKELAHSPLLLTFLCLVYDRSQRFPEKRATLYRKALRILLEEWAAEKRILRDEIYQGLDTELEEILLAEIAYKGFEQDQLFFSQQDLVERIRDFLTGNLNAPRNLGGEAVLDAIAIQQGILVERAESAFSFSHLTLQEYLVAQHVVDQGLAMELLKQHFTDERWREVWLLVVGLMRGGGDTFLLRMEELICQQVAYGPDSCKTGPQA